MLSHLKEAGLAQELFAAIPVPRTVKENANGIHDHHHSLGWAPISPDLIQVNLTQILQVAHCFIIQLAHLDKEETTGLKVKVN